MEKFKYHKTTSLKESHAKPIWHAKWKNTEKKSREGKIKIKIKYNTIFVWHIHTHASKIDYGSYIMNNQKICEYSYMFHIKMKCFWAKKNTKKWKKIRKNENENKNKINVLSENMEETRREIIKTWIFCCFFAGFHFFFKIFLFFWKEFYLWLSHFCPIFVFL